MGKFILVNYYSEIKKNIFSTAVIFCALCAFFGFLSEIYGRRYYENIESSMKDYYYYSEITEISNNYIYMADKLSKNREIDEVGYELFASGEYIEDKYINVVYLGGCTKDIQYKLKSGEWSKVKEKNNVIIGGEIAKEYNCNDSICLKNDEGKEKEYNVCGVLKYNSMMLLNDGSGENLTLQDIMSDVYDSYIILTDDDAIDFFDMNKDWAMSYILKSHSGNFNNLKGTACSFKDIKSNSKADEKSAIKINATALVVFFLQCLLTVLIEILITIDRNMDKIKCIYICGCTKLQTNVVLISNTLINLLIAFMAYYVFFMHSINSTAKRGFYQVVVKTELIMLLIVSVIAYIFAALMTRKQGFFKSEVSANGENSFKEYN